MTDREEPVATPGSMIVTFAGLHLREIGGWIAVADLIALLRLAGQAPPAVRQALVRLKSRGFLASRKHDGRAGYALTETGLADLAVGDSRIFRYGEAADSDDWILALFSVPEDARSQRHRLRSNLSWLGFGVVSSGVRIAPAALADRAAALLESEGLSEYVTWFTGRTVGPADVATWWDLDALRDLYESFLRRWESISVGASNPADGSDRIDDAASFANYVALVDDWRQFPRIDPGLPAALLPDGWQGRRAFEVFSRLHQRWADRGRRFVLESLGTPVSAR